VRFSFGFGRGSQTCTVSGTAKFRFAQVTPERDMQGLESDLMNEMAVEIFRENYETVFLLHESLGAEAPSPWITRRVTVSTRMLQEDSEQPIGIVR